MADAIIHSLKQMLQHLEASVEQFLPRVLVMLVIIVMGWLIAVLSKAIVRRALVLAKFDALSESAGTAQLLRNAALPAPRDLVASLTFWVVWIVFLLVGINALGVVSLRDQISQLLLFLPQIFVAVLILFVGFLLANFLARAALLAAVNANLPFARLLAGSVRFLVVLLTVSMALEQIALAHRTVLIAFTILFGAVMLGLAIAFGIAGQHLARDVLQKRFAPAEPEKEEEITHL
jgi:Conserved TM helix